MPKTHNTPKRTFVIKTRLTEEEHADFMERLKLYEMSQAEFIRQAITGVPIKPIVNVGCIDDKFLEAVGKLTAEYGKIGSNLNQIARTLNQWCSPYPQLAAEIHAAASDLAACIANGLIEKEISVRMTNFTTILNDLGASFEGRNEYIERLCRFPLLIIDDLGTERGTEYALEHVYNVIDSRYRSGKPLILTANISPDVLNNPPDIAHARIYSRILEMCVPIHVTGIQNRKQTAQRKMETLKNMMND